MGIDVSAAKIRAGQLTQYKYWLENARAKMREYQTRINANWSGMEVSDIDTAIRQVISSLDHAIRELDQVSGDVVRVADAIRREEAEAERQQKMQEASGQIARIHKDIRKLDRQKQELERQMADSADPYLQEKLDEIREIRQRAKRESSTWQSRLDVLRRQGGRS